MPDADVASQRAGDGGGPREDLALVSSRGSRALRVQDVPPEADLGGDEQPDGASRLRDETVHQRARAGEVLRGGTRGRVRLKDRDVQDVAGGPAGRRHGSALCRFSPTELVLTRPRRLGS